MTVIKKFLYNVAALILCSMFFLPIYAMEFGIDRPGGDYRSFNLETSDPNLCQSTCMDESACKAWTFVRPGHQGPTARCWLKNTIPEPNDAPCCISGIKEVTSKEAISNVEYGIDRPGMDYDSFDIDNDPLICQSRCLSESACRAWTFVQPGHQGPSARCWLKSDVPTAQKSSCCVSGVKN